MDFMAGFTCLMIYRFATVSMWKCLRTGVISTYTNCILQWSLLGMNHHIQTEEVTGPGPEYSFETAQVQLGIEYSGFQLLPLSVHKPYLNPSWIHSFWASNLMHRLGTVERVSPAYSTADSHIRELSSICLLSLYSSAQPLEDTLLDCEPQYGWNTSLIKGWDQG